MKLVLIAADTGETPVVALEEEKSGAKLVLGEGAPTQLLPLFGDYFGELIVITSFEVVPLDHSDHRRRSSMPPFRRSPECQMLWFGRLAHSWEGEPVVGQLLPLINKNGTLVPYNNCPLATVLHQLFRLNFGERGFVHLGVAEALGALDARCRSGLGGRGVVADALATFRISAEDIEKHAPILEGVVEETLADGLTYVQSLTDKMEAAKATFQAAQEVFQGESSKLAGEQVTAEARNDRLRAWLTEQATGKRRTAKR